MGWALTNTVGKHRYRFVVQQPATAVQGSWSGDVEGALGADWGFDYVGNAVTLQQVGSSNLWVGEGIPSSGTSWTPATAAQSQTAKMGFTYLAIAVQARDDLTRLVHTGSTYSFDVRVPTAWTVSQVMTYLQSKGWNVVSAVPTSDAVSFLAGRPTSIATTTAFAITGVWNGANKTSIADSDGTISYGIFSGQAPVSIAGSAPVAIGAASSSATPWLIALGLAGVAGLGLFAFARSRPKQNPSSPTVYFDDLPLEERQRHAQLWRASIAKLRELSYPFQATFDGEQVTVLGRARDFEPYASHPCKGNENTDEQMMVRGLLQGRAQKFIVFGHSLLVDGQPLVYHSGYRRRPVVDPLGLGWKENPIGVFIYDLDALDKLAELEGAEWLENDQRMWQQYRSGNTAHGFVSAWKYAHANMSPEDSPYWKDYFAGAVGIELGVIYGEGGYARFAVTDEGEIVLEGSSTRAERIDRATALGFRVVR